MSASHMGKWLIAGALLASSVVYGKGFDVTPYRMASAAQEADVARSAAPPSISADAEVLVLGDQGYTSVAPGKNGFVCVVERAWGAGFDDPVFWNSKIRGPICFNPAAARTVLAGYLERTKWVLAGESTQELIRHAQAAPDKSKWLPGPGAMCFMLSKQGYLSDTDGHWHPHLMFFVANSDAASWGANVAGSPVIATKGVADPTTTFMVPVSHWSDGTRDEAAHP